MAVDIDTIGIGVDSREVKTAAKELDNFGKSADKASRQADNFGKTTQSGATTASVGIARFASAAAGAFSVYAAFTKYVQSADTYTKITAQIKLATSTQEQYNTALSDVKRIATVAQTELEAVSKLYTRLSGSLSELGVEQRKIADVSETVALALRVSGATAGETASVMLQLSQAFGSGVLRGDEFNSMAENSPILLRALAASMGVTTGALRDMASEGLITRDVLLKAYGDPKLLEALRTQAKEINTIGGAWQYLKNQITLSVGELDKATKASNLFIESLKAVGNFVGEGNPFQIIGRAANATNNRFQQLLGISSPSNKSSDKSNGNAVPGMSVVGGGSYYPNYSATVVAQDIEKIHQKQEDYRKKAEEAAKKAQEADTTRRMGALQLYWENEGRRWEQFVDKKAAQYDAEEKADKAEYKRKMEQMSLLQKQANENFDEAQKRTKEAFDKAQRESDDLRRSLTDALLRSFERGEGGAKAFFNNLKNIFKARTFQIGIDFVLSKTGLSSIFGVMSSLLSGNALAGGTSGSGLNFSGIKDSFNAFSNGLDASNIAFEQSIQSFGSFITDFGGIGTKIGGAISQYSGFLSSAAPFLQAGLSLLSGDLKGAAFQGAGAAIGSIFGGPIGGAIGSFLGGALGGLFGGKLPPRYASGVETSVNNGALNSVNQSYKYKAAGGNDALKSLNEAVANNVNTLLKAYGMGGSLTQVGSALNKKVSSSGGISATIDGVQYADNTGKLKKGTIQQAFEALAELALGSFSAEIIKQSKLPDGVKKFFDNLTKKEDVIEAINTLAQLKLSLVDLPDVFNAVRNAIDTTAYKTSIDALKVQFQATQTFVELFYSDTEKFNIFTNQLVTQLASLNETLPTSREQYRALVESINVVDAATRDQFNGLVALAPAMDKYFQYLEQTADGINQVNEALAQALDKNYFRTYADYVTAQANASAGMTYTGSIGDLSVRRSQGDAELVNAVKSLVAQQARTDQILAEIAESTRKSREINERWEGDGLPETRTV